MLLIPDDTRFLLHQPVETDFAIRKPNSSPSGIERTARRMPSRKINCFICFRVAPQRLDFSVPNLLGDPDSGRYYK